MGRRRVAVGLALALLPALAACRPGTVEVGFHPVPGSSYAYAVSVDTTATLRLDGRPAETTPRSLSLRADHTVLESGPDGSRVEVVLRPTAGEPRTVLVRLDRGAQLVGVEGEASALGDLGVPELFPAAAAAPPARPLRPGERWELDSPVALPDSAPTRLRGRGRLQRLGVVNGRRAATVVTTYDLPIVRRTDSGGREAVLEGLQTTTTRVTHALADGAVERAESLTSATYEVRLLPPDGVSPPVRGTLELRVSSTTTRT